MKSFYKYLIFFVLGIILSLIFKKDLVEGVVSIPAINLRPTRQEYIDAVTDDVRRQAGINWLYTSTNIQHAGTVIDYEQANNMLNERVRSDLDNQLRFYLTKDQAKQGRQEGGRTWTSTDDFIWDSYESAVTKMGCSMTDAWISPEQVGTNQGTYLDNEGRCRYPGEWPNYGTSQTQGDDDASQSQGDEEGGIKMCGEWEGSEPLEAPPCISSVDVSDPQVAGEHPDMLIINNFYCPTPPSSPFLPPRGDAVAGTDLHSGRFTQADRKTPQDIINRSINEAPGMTGSVRWGEWVNALTPEAPPPAPRGTYTDDPDSCWLNCAGSPDCVGVEYTYFNGWTTDTPHANPDWQTPAHCKYWNMDKFNELNECIPSTSTAGGPESVVGINDSIHRIGLKISKLRKMCGPNYIIPEDDVDNSRNYKCYKCPDGTQPNQDKTVCLGPGYNTDGSPCEGNNYSSGNDDCTLCPNGTRPIEDKTGCLGPGFDATGSLCEGNNYSSGNDDCIPCGDGSFVIPGKTGCTGPGYDTDGNACDDTHVSPNGRSDCSSCELPDHPNISKSQCVRCPNGRFISTNSPGNECEPCLGNSVPDENHEKCVECDRPVGHSVDEPGADGTHQYSLHSGPGFKSNSDNTECLNPMCTIPTNTTGYDIIDDNGLLKDDFYPKITCSTEYAGNPTAMPCEQYGGNITLEGCYPENMFNENSKCGDFKNGPVNLTEKCNKLNKNVLENKSCDSSNCVSTDYCCSSSIPEEIKNLSNEIYFSDQYEMTNMTTQEFNSWYEERNRTIQQLRDSLDDGQTPNYNLLTLKPEILNLFNSGNYNRNKFKENWIGSGGGQEEIASIVWERLINTINLNRSVEENIQYTDNLSSEQNQNDLKLLLINLDKPIRNTDSDIDLTYKYPNEDDTSGLSPLDLFLYNDPDGNTASQLEELL